VPLVIHPVFQAVGTVRVVVLAHEVGTVGGLHVIGVTGRRPAVDSLAVQGPAAALQAVVPPAPGMAHPRRILVGEERETE